MTRLHVMHIYFHCAVCIFFGDNGYQIKKNYYFAGKLKQFDSLTNFTGVWQNLEIPFDTI